MIDVNELMINDYVYLVDKNNRTLIKIDELNNNTNFNDFEPIPITYAFFLDNNWEFFDDVFDSHPFFHKNIKDGYYFAISTTDNISYSVIINSYDLYTDINLHDIKYIHQFQNILRLINCMDEANNIIVKPFINDDIFKNIEIGDAFLTRKNKKAYFVKNIDNHYQFLVEKVGLCNYISNGFYSPSEISDLDIIKKLDYYFKEKVKNNNNDKSILND